MEDYGREFKKKKKGPIYRRNHRCKDCEWRTSMGNCDVSRDPKINNEGNCPLYLEKKGGK